MSPKPVDFRRALDTLRQERPSPEAEARVRAALAQTPQPLPSIAGRGSRRSLARPLTAMLIATALAVVVLTPRSKAGSAWAQTLVNTLDVPTHSVSTDRDGEREEAWSQGAKRAHVTFTSRGTLMIESRSDGVRNFTLINSAGFGHGKANPNSQTYGIVYDVRRTFEPLGDDFASLERLLKRSDVRVTAHEPADPSKGAPERYRLQFGREIPMEIVVEVDPSALRIKALTVPLIGRRTEIDYPAHIPSAVFAPQAQVAKGLPTYDVEALRKIARERLAGSLARQGPVNLRLVTLDADGALWAFWTGAPPTRDLKPPIRLPKVSTGPAFGMRVFTADWATAAITHGNPHYRPGGLHLGGMGVVPNAKIGPTVDLDVPYPEGVAHFRNVPVLRIAVLPHLDEELGVQRKYSRPQKK